MSLGERIKYYRERLGWTLQDLEDRSGVPFGTISALENRKSQRTKYAVKIAVAFGMTVENLEDEGRDWLFYDEMGNPHPLKAEAPPAPALTQIAAPYGKHAKAARPRQDSRLTALVGYWHDTDETGQAAILSVAQTMAKQHPAKHRPPASGAR